MSHSTLNPALITDQPEATAANRHWAIPRDDVPTEGGFDPQYGNVTWQTMICNSRMESRGLVLGVAQIPGFGRLPLHRHDPAECCFTTSGDGENSIAGQITKARGGMAIFIPGGAEHGIPAGPDGNEFLYGFPIAVLMTSLITSLSNRMWNYENWIHRPRQCRRQTQRQLAAQWL